MTLYQCPTEKGKKKKSSQPVNGRYKVLHTCLLCKEKYAIYFLIIVAGDVNLNGTNRRFQSEISIINCRTNMSEFINFLFSDIWLFFVYPFKYIIHSIFNSFETQQSFYCCLNNIPIEITALIFFASIKNYPKQSTGYY